MSRTSLLALPLVAALALLLNGPRPLYAASAPLPVPAQVARPVSDVTEPSPQPEPEQPTTHTMTIYNGPRVVQRNFVYQDGSWRSLCKREDFRACPRPPEHLCGTYHSPRAHGCRVAVRHHCA